MRTPAAFAAEWLRYESRRSLPAARVTDPKGVPGERAATIAASPSRLRRSARDDGRASSNRSAGENVLTSEPTATIAADSYPPTLTRGGPRNGVRSLAHVQQLRGDILKIDQSFIANLGREARNRKIVAAVIAMAPALGMTVVGEGIENDTARSELTAMSCEEGQGCLLAPPIPASDLRSPRLGPGTRTDEAQRWHPNDTSGSLPGTQSSTAASELTGSRAPVPAERSRSITVRAGPCPRT